MAELDPFTQVFNALWQIIDSHAVLSGFTNQGGQVVPGLLRAGNKIRYNTVDRDPTKDSILDTDMPELILAASGITMANMYATSCSSMVQRTYQWLLSTGDFRINMRLFPVQFALFSAMLDWETVLSTLTWRNKKFVLKCAYGTGHEGLSIPTLNRNIKGWSSIWACTVDMQFQSDDLRFFNIGD